MANRSATKATPSTQKYLQIAEIKDDVVIMKDGSLRAVLLVSSINFALKSDDEQNAIISAYVSFLNSLGGGRVLANSRKNLFLLSVYGSESLYRGPVFS